MNPDVESVNNFNSNSLAHHLGIEITEFGENFVKAKMPVDQRTRQPLGLLHGGASVVLSETVGSIASWMAVGDPNKHIVGLEVNANHLTSPDLIQRFCISSTLFSDSAMEEFVFRC